MATDIDTLLTKYAPAQEPDNASLEQTRRRVMATLPGQDAEVTSEGTGLRSRRTRRRLVLVGVAATVAAGLTGIGWWTTERDVAFAEWESTGSTLTGGALTDAATECVSENIGVIGLDNSMTPGVVDGTLLTPIVSEQRGPYSFTVTAYGDVVFDCFRSPTGGGSAMRPAAKGDPAPIDVMGAGTTSDPQEGSYSQVVARISPEIEAVTVTAGDGTYVNASIADGYAVAWWPGQVDGATLTWTFTDGTTGTADLLELPNAPQLQDWVNPVPPDPRPGSVSSVPDGDAAG